MCRRVDTHPTSTPTDGVKDVSLSFESNVLVDDLSEFRTWSGHGGDPTPSPGRSQGVRVSVRVYEVKEKFLPSPLTREQSLTETGVLSLLMVVTLYFSVYIAGPNHRV